MSAQKDERRGGKVVMVNVPFSLDEVLILHAVACLSDGRTAMAKLMRKRISPVALPILKARHGLQEPKKGSPQGRVR